MSWGDPLSPDQIPGGGLVTMTPEGQRSFRNKNVFNVEYHDWMQPYGATLSPDGRFAQFQTYEDSVRAATDLIKRNYANKSIREGINTFAPPWQNKNTPQRIKETAAHFGVSPDTKIGELPLGPFMAFQAKYESPSQINPTIWGELGSQPIGGDKFAGASKVAAKTPGGGWGAPISEKEMSGWGNPVSTTETTQTQPTPPVVSPQPDQPAAGGREQISERHTPVADIMEKAMPYIRPALELGGMTAGGIVGGGAGTFGGGPVGTAAGSVTGGGLGYATGKKTADAIAAAAGLAPTPSLGESLKQSGRDVITGAMMEAGGQVGGKVLQAGLKGAGKVGAAVLGGMSGQGIGTVEEAIKSGKAGEGWNIFNPKTAFNRAMRNQITKDEVVDMAQDALQTLKNKRSADYQGKLAAIGQIQGDLDITTVQAKLRDLMKQFRVKVDPTTSELDFSAVAIGNKGRKDIKEMVETVWGWPDKTPLGIDALKRYLSDFYSESSQARAFTASITKEVTRTLEKQVPQYVEMTKPYAEATKVIKDIESGLMMRKQGMTGRITADQTLRRLTSSMRDNFALRRDLVNVLGEQSGQDVAGAVAGQAMNQVLPSGLMRIASISEAGLMLTKILSPKFLPILVASSPRVQGEFLQIYGRALKESTGMSIPVAKMVSYLTIEKAQEKKRLEEGRTYRPGDPEIYSPNQAFSSSESR